MTSKRRSGLECVHLPVFERRSAGDSHRIWKSINLSKIDARLVPGCFCRIGIRASDEAIRKAVAKNPIGGLARVFCETQLEIYQESDG